MDFHKSQVNYPEYQNHLVFEEIKHMMSYYEGVSDTCYSFMATGVSGIGNYDSYVFMSMRATLESIQMLLKSGQITDAFILIRKFFDSVLVDLYIDVVRKEKFDVFDNLIVEDVENWIKKRHRIPSLKRILSILQHSDATKDLYPFFGWETYLKHNRDLLDDDVHSNRYISMLMNCRELVLEGREKRLDNASIILKQVFLVHLSFIFFLNGHFMMATDHLDYLEMGMTPPEGSEHWMAPYAQQAFDHYIKPHTELAIFIKEHCCLDID